MHLGLFVCIAFISLSLFPIFSFGRQNGSERDERFLSLFKAVRIPHQLCSPPERMGMGDVQGSCYTRKQCLRINGTIAGTCAQNYGVCCLETCSTRNAVTVNVNGTHLISPANLQGPSICRYRFPRLKDVCQVRLDFLRFESNQPTIDPMTMMPDPEGDCVDTLTFSGASNTPNLGPLCGNLTGQHVYLDYGVSSEIGMSLYTAMALMNARAQNWDIQVTYIKCGSTELAPTGCLQYFTEQTGTVQSFNFNGGQQLNNEDYSVCIKPVPGMTRILWTSCSGLNSFVVTGNSRAAVPAPLPPIPPQPGQGSMCMTDWVMIFGVDKYCGNAFTGTVTSITMPFLLQVHFDASELNTPVPPPDDRNQGFCLMYQQLP